MADEDEIIGKNIRRARKAAGMNQTELAAAMGEHGFPWRQNVVSRVEIGQRELLLQEIQALQDILGQAITSGTQLEQSAVQLGRAFDGVRRRATEQRLKKLTARLDEMQDLLDANREDIRKLNGYWNLDDYDDLQGDDDGQSS